MKTRLYIPPGTVLEWDNESHRRRIEDEAYADYDKHPKPTKTPPERSPFWGLWRAFGMFLYDPIRTAGRGFLWQRANGHAGAQRIHDWIGRGATKGKDAKWLRALLSWLVDDHYSTCPTCGFTEFHDEFTLPDGRDVDMFEWVDGGDVDYWGEGQDAYGWQWCYRCGQVSWECA